MSIKTLESVFYSDLRHPSWPGRISEHLIICYVFHSSTFVILCAGADVMFMQLQCEN